MLKIYIGPNGYGKSYRMSKDIEKLKIIDEDRCRRTRNVEPECFHVRKF